MTEAVRITTVALNMSDLAIAIVMRAMFSVQLAVEYVLQLVSCGHMSSELYSDYITALKGNDACAYLDTAYPLLSIKTVHTTDYYQLLASL